MSNILLGVLSFMLEETPTYGSIETSDEIKRQLARQSLQFNVEKTDEWFPYLFPDIFARSSEVKDGKQERPKEETASTKGGLNVAVVMPEDVVVPPAHCACQPSDLTVFLVPLVVFLSVLLFFIVLAFVLAM